MEQSFALKTIPHFRKIAVRDSSVKAVLVTPAIYNRIHDHLHGFAMSVFGDMAEREPVTVASYRLEPSSVLKSCNTCNRADLNLAGVHTCSISNTVGGGVGEKR